MITRVPQKLLLDGFSASRVRPHSSRVQHIHTRNKYAIPPTTVPPLRGIARERFRYVCRNRGRSRTRDAQKNFTISKIVKTRAVTCVQRNTYDIEQDFGGAPFVMCTGIEQNSNSCRNASCWILTARRLFG